MAYFDTQFHHTITNVNCLLPLNHDDTESHDDDDDDSSQHQLIRIHQCDRCGGQCSSFIQVDRWSPGFTERKSTLVFCNESCFNDAASDYLQDAFRDGWLDGQAMLVNPRLRLVTPDYLCTRCGVECYDDCVVEEPTPDQILVRAIAFCDDGCHTDFARDYFCSAVEMGWLDGSAVAEAHSDLEN